MREVKPVRFVVGEAGIMVHWPTGQLEWVTLGNAVRIVWELCKAGRPYEVEQLKGNA